MKVFINILKIIGKVLATLIVLPISLVGGASIGVFYLLAMMMYVPFSILSDIWGIEYE